MKKHKKKVMLVEVTNYLTSSSTIQKQNFVQRKYKTLEDINLDITLNVKEDLCPIHS